LRVEAFAGALVFGVGEHVQQEWRGLFVAKRAKRLRNRVAGVRGAALHGLLEHLVGLGGPDLYDRPQRFALHLRILIVEHLPEIGQCRVTGEAAQQIDRGSAHRRIA